MTSLITLPKKTKKILIIKPSSLGDIIHTLPALSVIRDSFPDASISWVVSRGFQHILEGHPQIDRLIIFERKRWGGIGFLNNTQEIFKFFVNLGRERFDLVIDFQGLIRSALIAFSTFAPLRIGFENARELSPIFYTHRVKVPDKDMHSVKRLSLILEAMGLSGIIHNVPIPLTPKELEEAMAILECSGITMIDSNIVTICPGASWESKRWVSSHFAGLIDKLHDNMGIKSVLIGGASDDTLGKEILSMTVSSPINLIGKTTIKQTAAIIKMSRVMVSNDSGPMHISAAMGTPVIAIFGPTSPLRTGPFGSGHIVLQKKLPCVPCFCRKCSTLNCLKEIEIEDVLRAVETKIFQK